MATKEQPLKRVMVTQQLDAAFWLGWSAAELVELASEDAERIGNVIVARMEAGQPRVAQAYSIIHDKDEYCPGFEKVHHVHMIADFEPKTGVGVSALAALVGVEVQFLEKPDSKYSWDNWLAYLVHAKDTSKHQYAASEVKTLKGRDYAEIYEERWEAWMKGRASVARKRVTADLDWVLEQCLMGELTRSQILLSDDLARAYALHRSKIDDALNTYAQVRALRAAEKLRRGEFKTTIHYIYGPAGLGKTRLGLAVIKKLQEDAAAVGESWEVHRGGRTNPMDNWQGEEITFLDEVRPNSMRPDDLLNLLDPHEAGTASARFRNKENVAPRAIIMTSPLHPANFFYYAQARGEVSEALDQFVRRLTTVVRMYEVKPDGIDAEYNGARYEVSYPRRLEDAYNHAVIENKRGVLTVKDSVAMRFAIEAAVDTDDSALVASVLAGHVADASNDLELEGFDWSSLDEGPEPMTDEQQRQLLEDLEARGVIVTGPLVAPLQ